MTRRPSLLIGLFAWRRSLALPGLLPALFLAALALAGCSAEHGTSTGAPLGRVSLSVARAPGDAQCLRVFAQGPTRSEERRFTLVADQPFSQELTGLPIGQVTFRADALAAACEKANGSSVPTWVSKPVAVAVLIGQVAEVHVTLVRNGRAGVDVTFDGEGGQDGSGGAGGDGPGAGTGGEAGSADQGGGESLPLPIPGDVIEALGALPYVEVDAVTRDGIPRSVSGHLAFVPDLTGDGVAAGALAPVLDLLAPVFRLHSPELALESVEVDEQGHIHARFAQSKSGLPVAGGTLLVHADDRGVVYNAAGTARDGVDLPPDPVVDQADAEATALSRPELAGGTVTAAALTYVVSTRDERLYLAFALDIRATSSEGAEVRERVFVDATTGLELDEQGLLEDSLSRRVFLSGSSTPARAEGAGPSGIGVVDGQYDLLGDAYECYQSLFGRDSYDNAGGRIDSTVNAPFTCNAFWSGSDIVFGLPGSACSNLALSRDVVVHELTHAVTQYGSGLVYAGEPGALNEGLSDIFASRCDAWKRGSVVPQTWLIAEDAFPTSYGLRSMSNPTVDGVSSDYYPERFTGLGDHGGVHLNSGIANLAFKLLATGGTHPRGKTSLAVPAVGIAVAGDVFYRMNSAGQLPSNGAFVDARLVSARLANQFHGASARDATQAAWAAVGVGDSQPPNSPFPPAPCSVSLTPLTASYGAAGGTGTVRVQASSASCAWSARSLAAWISITGSASGTGDADVAYAVAQNTTTSRRIAPLIVNGATLTIAQDTNTIVCTYVTNPDSASLPAGGGSGTVTVDTSFLCPWSVASPVSWLTFDRTSGSGGATLKFQASANPGPDARSATATVAGVPLTVTQAAPTAKHKLSLSVSGDGAVSAGTQSCSAGTCLWTFDNGATVQLVAKGSSFSGWSGSGSGTQSTCTVVLDRDVSVGASFGTAPPPPPPTQTLALSIVGTGSVTLSDNTGTKQPPCTTSCSRTYATGSTVTLTVTSGTLTTWGGDCTRFEKGATCQVVMDASRSATATFSTSSPPPTGPVVVAETSVTVPTPSNPEVDLHDLSTALMASGSRSYQLDVSVSQFGATGFVQVYQAGSVPTKLAEVSCRTSDTNAACTSSGSVVLDKSLHYLWALRVTDNRTGSFLPVGGTAQVVMNP